MSRNDAETDDTGMGVHEKNQRGGEAHASPPVINLSGQWSLALREKENHQGFIHIPGTLQAQGYGDEISRDTPWVSGLHDACWYVRDEYAYAQESGVRVPFLSQPPRHFIGKAWYGRSFTLDVPADYVLRIELAHWKSTVSVDGTEKGSDFSLCTPHQIPLGHLEAGTHEICVLMDNSFSLPYRPDGHGVSDALAATWNGMGGEIVLLTNEEIKERQTARSLYAAAHQRQMEVKGGMFLVNGKSEYLRGTHFGGDYPLSGMPDVSPAFWTRIMDIVTHWGLNFIRCHSYCPPQAAFAAADKAGVFIQVEAGMWNIFNPGIPMVDILRGETRRILKEFGHHPSFVLFSPSNEPGGSWYVPLCEWVKETRDYDHQLGYGGRRLYTAQSGWFYDVPPRDITEKDTDYIYFHRSGYGPILGGNIRNSEGWKGKDYGSSLEGATLPVIAHELGQWCSYPDFSIISKFTGYMRPGNYEVYQEHARQKGLLKYNALFSRNSGKLQAMMYKEELEANFRTPHIQGFELLDIHDYLGQGMATVGILDAFWDEKGYVDNDEWRRFCSPTVLLARLPGYVFRTGQKVEVPVEICHYGESPVKDAVIIWSLTQGKRLLASGVLPRLSLPFGKNIHAGVVELDLACVKEPWDTTFTLRMGDVSNCWTLHVYPRPEGLERPGRLDTHDAHDAEVDALYADVLHTKDWTVALEALDKGHSVLFTPRLDELDYDCPPASFKPVFWNAQMGPSWQRGMGMVVDTSHPVFMSFPSESWGGWQWEDIFDRARSFCMEGLPALNPIMRLIDDHNRSLDLAFMFECRMSKGKLMVVTADLEGRFEERPAAYTFMSAIRRYLGSKGFNPVCSVEPDFISHRLHPNRIMLSLDARLTGFHGREYENAESLVDGNPNTSFILRGTTYPLSLDMRWNGKKTVLGVIMLQGQKNRMHEGDMKEILITALHEDGLPEMIGEYELRSTLREQRLMFDSPRSLSGIRLTVRSGFQKAGMKEWREWEDGWHHEETETEAIVEIAVFNLIVAEQVGSEDVCYWKATGKTSTKEIEA
ncbi:glycoside hydrolase family 2 [Parasphaerochaeta coccoides]|uniref:Glycoside hydrolase family 2 sugar binding protein n=1 Tax=Parasphaerochaeta coccoides (strain ATCC BAA-1237 / DSM 17374 / SPN1) TaxID=760011 RepID=F4GIW4_PARC1|nr:glycoside hydrolase family 2 [Parasphaerochaeta coccoides]AEC02732.1 glycoside hydrolase family 2 sugar binding protein [Parasphaerochaeta coccoides DSM 17374]